MTDLNAMPDHAKIWMYQADRLFSEKENELILEKITSYVNSWDSHGEKVHASGFILHNLYIVLTADEKINAPGGCSIDASVNFIKALGKEFNINFFNRFNFAYRNGEKIEIADRETFSKLYDQGIIHDETQVFNYLVDQKGKLTSEFEIQLKDSWHKNFV